MLPYISLHASIVGGAGCRKALKSAGGSVLLVSLSLFTSSRSTRAKAASQSGEQKAVTLCAVSSGSAATALEAAAASKFSLRTGEGWKSSSGLAVGLLWEILLVEVSLRPADLWFDEDASGTGESAWPRAFLVGLELLLCALCFSNAAPAPAPAAPCTDRSNSPSSPCLFAIPAVLLATATFFFFFFGRLDAAVTN